MRFLPGLGGYTPKDAYNNAATATTATATATVAVTPWWQQRQQRS